ncbi:MAG: hypothetical protein IKG87_15290 [Clostridia bacterium]|nr:hypothetical protein [Clostridia bacterium]
MNQKEYFNVIATIKTEIRSAQYRAAASANKELLLLYYHIGKIINAHKTWGNKFIENLSRDLRTEYPDAKGFSVRNLKYMAKFASTYPDDELVQTVSALISWSHNIAIIDKVKDQQKRIWYINQSYLCCFIHGKLSDKCRLVMMNAFDRRFFFAVCGKMEL